MHYLLIAITASFLVGCAGSPPNPPTFTGDYRPVNKTELPESKPAPYTRAKNDFTYKGDIANALIALKQAHPALEVMPSTGQPTPFPISVNLKAATLEDSLRAVGEQGGNVAEVVWNSTHNRNVNQAFIRYRAASINAGSQNN